METDKKEATAKGTVVEGEGKGEISKEELWEMITAYQGKTIYTAKGLPLTYRVKGGELFADRKKKSITRATFEQAYQKIIEDSEHKIIASAHRMYGRFSKHWAWFRVYML